MDEQYRKDLERNDLHEFLANFNAWWAMHGTKVMLVITAGAVTLLIYNLTVRWQAEAHENAWSQLATASGPAVFQAVAQDVSDPAVQALAKLEAADLLMLEAPVSGEQADPAAVDVAKVERAEALYRDVAETAPHVVYQLNAWQGVAVAAEARRDVEAARAAYDRLIELAGDQFPTWAETARSRQASLDDLTRPVVFASEPSPIATQAPAIPSLDALADPATISGGPGASLTDLNTLMNDATGTLPASPSESTAPETPATPTAPANEAPAAAPQP